MRTSKVTLLSCKWCIRRIIWRKCLPFWAKWQTASSKWRLVEVDDVFKFATNHKRAPSSIRSERPLQTPDVNLLRWLDNVKRNELSQIMIPFMILLDSHLAKLASPLATWAMTSLFPDLVIPNRALMDPSSFRTACNFSAFRECTSTLMCRYNVIYRQVVLSIKEEIEIMSFCDSSENELQLYHFHINLR